MRECWKGEGRAQGWAGEKSDCFGILLGTCG